jgi:hypothetical protein
VTKNEVPAFYSTYCVCISFCEPLMARSHLIGVDFLWNRFHRLIQANKDVTENEVSPIESKGDQVQPIKSRK